jgi:hypothetical protein
LSAFNHLFSGAISQYGAWCIIIFIIGVDTFSLEAGKATGLRNYLTLIAQRAKIQGFIVYV